MSVPTAALPPPTSFPQPREGKGGRGGRVTVGGEGPPIPVVVLTWAGSGGAQSVKVMYGCYDAPPPSTPLPSLLPLPPPPPSPPLLSPTPRQMLSLWFLSSATYGINKQLMYNLCRPDMKGVLSTKAARPRLPLGKALRHYKV
ncbi:hypothetical protein E2C01_077942 [Portunus trituberculatus]|uniref:Uncharacterized protein n=1 Tax=Portunus trituberculatus TaxID=210409 RepID=A0A5B7IRF5_PORTR|nr:hypothetical protein [Portunus trituberculatus]